MTPFCAPASTEAHTSRSVGFYSSRTGPAIGLTAYIAGHRARP